MRKFYLENAVGDRVGLQTRRDLFLHLPQGLGWANDNTYLSANGFFPRVYSEPQQPCPTGEFVFGSYARYSEVMAWIFGGYDLTLVYDATGTEYKIDVDITSISKGELTQGVLICPFTMAAKTPWYKPSTRSLVIAPPPSDVGYKIYDYSYPYQYTTSSMSNAVEILAGGHMPAALYITCGGILTNPCLTLTDAAGTVLGKCDLTGVSFGVNDTLRFSTRFGNIGVWKNNTDLLPQLDLTNNNFFEVPVGKTVTLTLASASNLETVATILLYEYYRSV